MPEPDLILVFLRPLNRAGVRYAVTGRVAVVFYGEPRLTLAMDLVVFLNSMDFQRLGRHFPPSEFYLPPPEVIGEEMTRERAGHFIAIHHATGFKADFYLAGRDELNAWALRSRKSMEFDGETIQLAPPEYVIVRKLEYFREGGSEKHLRDIRSIPTVSG